MSAPSFRDADAAMAHAALPALDTRGNTKLGFQACDLNKCVHTCHPGHEAEGDVLGLLLLFCDERHDHDLRRERFISTDSFQVTPITKGSQGETD